MIAEVTAKMLGILSFKAQYSCTCRLFIIRWYPCHCSV